MNVARNIQEPTLILSTVLLSKTDMGLKRFFRKIGTIFELCDFKNGCGYSLNFTFTDELCLIQ